MCFSNYFTYHLKNIFRLSSEFSFVFLRKIFIATQQIVKISTTFNALSLWNVINFLVGTFSDH